MNLKPHLTTCSVCSANLQIFLKDSDFISCESCGTTFKKRDYTLSKSDQFYYHPETMSPLAVGTEGKIEKKEFKITGRQIFKSDSFVCNLWQIVFDDYSTACISDIAGEYALVYNESISPYSFKNESFIAGKKQDLPELVNYFVDGLFLIKADYPEGELLKCIDVGNESIMIFLSKADDKMAMIFFGKSKDPVLYKGNIIAFEKFEFKLLRDVSNW